MAKRIQVDEIISLNDKEWLGKWPTRGDVDVIYNEDADIYLPDGQLAVIYRRGSLKSTIPVEEGGTLTPENYEYWRWVSKYD